MFGVSVLCHVCSTHRLYVVLPAYYSIKCSTTQFLSPRACYRYTDGLYTPTINMQVIDRYGRKSNIVSKKLVVSTCKLLFASFFLI